MNGSLQRRDQRRSWVDLGAKSDSVLRVLGVPGVPGSACGWAGQAAGAAEGVCAQLI